MTVIAIRCQNGTVLWRKEQFGPGDFRWVCFRDNFQIASPDTVADAGAMLNAMVQHTVVLVGAVLQVVQLEL